MELDPSQRTGGLTQSTGAGASPGQPFPTRTRVAVAPAEPSQQVEEAGDFRLEPDRAYASESRKRRSSSDGVFVVFIPGTVVVADSICMDSSWGRLRDRTRRSGNTGAERARARRESAARSKRSRPRALHGLRSGIGAYACNCRSMPRSGRLAASSAVINANRRRSAPTRGQVPARQTALQQQLLCFSGVEAFSQSGEATRGCGAFRR